MKQLPSFSESFNSVNQNKENCMRASNMFAPKKADLEPDEKKKPQNLPTLSLFSKQEQITPRCPLRDITKDVKEVSSPNDNKQ